MILSQDAIIARPSKLWTRVTNSTDMATMSLPTCSYFSSSAPLAMLPQVAGIPNSTGTPPAAQIPSFTASAICLRWPFQGTCHIGVGHADVRFLSDIAVGIARSLHHHPAVGRFRAVPV